MTSYGGTRDNEQLRLLDVAVGRFITDYQNAWQLPGPCQRQTVFFFPGGMASRLMRAQQPYLEGTAFPPNANYDELWLAPEIFFGAWRKLAMYRDGGGCFRDHQDRFIVADGAVSLLGVTPHELFVWWCKTHNADLFVFGWDWRRRLDETVDFFLDQFLPMFRARVMAAGLPDPLARYSLVGHSLGGMVVNLMLRSGHPLLANLSSAVTVGTPFYGYGGQLHRCFEGEPLLSGIEVDALEALGLHDLANAARLDMLEAISSMPGLYTVHYLDAVTYADPATGAALAADPEFPLAGYPGVDLASGSPADPYNPQSSGILVRYPGNTGFDLGELDYARAQVQAMMSPMPAAVAARFYNIRGVVTAADDHTPVGSTAGSLSWGWIPPNFDPGGPSPLADTSLVAGDDTQPAFSARLVSNPRCVTVRGSMIDHMFLMSHPATLAAIEQILCT